MYASCMEYPIVTCKVTKLPYGHVSAPLAVPRGIFRVPPLLLLASERQGTRTAAAGKHPLKQAAKAPGPKMICCFDAQEASMKLMESSMSRRSLASLTPYSDLLLLQSCWPTARGANHPPSILPQRRWRKRGKLSMAATMHISMM